MTPPGAVCASCGAHVIVGVVLRHGTREWTLCRRCYVEPVLRPRSAQR